MSGRGAAAPAKVEVPLATPARPAAGRSRNPAVDLLRGGGTAFLKQVKAISDAKVAASALDVGVSEGTVAAWVHDLSDPWPVRFYCPDTDAFASFLFGDGDEPRLELALPDFPFLGDPRPTELVLPARRDYAFVQLYLDRSGTPMAAKAWDQVPAPLPSSVRMMSDETVRIMLEQNFEAASGKSVAAADAPLARRARLNRAIYCRVLAEVVVGDDISEILPDGSIDRVMRGPDEIWAARRQSHGEQPDEWLYTRWGYPEGFGVFPSATAAPIPFTADMTDTFGFGRGPLFCCGGRLPLPVAVRCPRPSPPLSPRLERALRQSGVEWRPGMPVASVGALAARAGVFGEREPSLRRRVALEMAAEARAAALRRPPVTAAPAPATARLPLSAPASRPVAPKQPAVQPRRAMLPPAPPPRPAGAASGSSASGPGERARARAIEGGQEAGPLAAARGDQVRAQVEAFLAAWPEELVAIAMEGPTPATSHSRETVLRGLRFDCEQYPGALGARLRSVRCWIESYRGIRREHGFALESDFPITSVGLRLFLARRLQTSKSRNERSVRQSLLRVLRSGVVYGLLKGSDVDLGSLKDRRKGSRGTGAASDEWSYRAAAGLELDAAGLGQEGLPPLSAEELYLARSCVWMLKTGARAGNFESAVDVRVVATVDGETVQGYCDLKDGSKGAWFGFPNHGVMRRLEWSAEHAELVGRVGLVFPAFEQGAATRRPAKLSRVRSVLRKLVVRRGMPVELASALTRGHGARHFSPCVAMRLLWSREARSELGMWNEGELEMRWLGGELRTVPRAVGRFNGDRYAEGTGGRETQLRLRRALDSAVVELYGGRPLDESPWSNALPDAVVHACSFYKAH